MAFSRNFDLLAFRGKTSENKNNVLCCTASEKQRHDRICESVPRYERTYRTAAGHSADTGCLSGMAEEEKRLAITNAHSIFTKGVTSHCTVAGTRMMRCPLLPENRTLVAWGHTLSAFYRLGKAYIFNPTF